MVQIQAQFKMKSYKIFCDKIGTSNKLGPCCYDRIVPWSTRKYIPHAFFQAAHALTILSLLSFLCIVPSHLQPQANTFGDCRLGKRGLDHRNQFTCQRTSFWTNQVAFLLYSRHDSKIKREVRRNDATDSLLPEFLLTFKFWKWRGFYV